MLQSYLLKIKRTISNMEKKSIKTQELFIKEEEKLIVWENVQSSFEKNFGTKIYTSWLKNLTSKLKVWAVNKRATTLRPA